MGNELAHSDITQKPPLPPYRCVIQRITNNIYKKKTENVYVWMYVQYKMYLYKQFNFIHTYINFVFLPKCQRAKNKITRKLKTFSIFISFSLFILKINQNETDLKWNIHATDERKKTPWPNGQYTYTNICEIFRRQQWQRQFFEKSFENCQKQVYYSSIYHGTWINVVSK